MDEELQLLLNIFRELARKGRDRPYTGVTINAMVKKKIGYRWQWQNMKNRLDRLERSGFIRRVGKHGSSVNWDLVGGG